MEDGDFFEADNINLDRIPNQDEERKSPQPDTENVKKLRQKLQRAETENIDLREQLV